MRTISGQTGALGNRAHQGSPGPMNVARNFAMKGSPRMKVLGGPVRAGLESERGTKTAAHIGPRGSGVPEGSVFHCARSHTT